MSTCPFGFLIRGATTEARRLVDHAAAFLAYATLDERTDVQREAYLSAFAFGDDFRRLLDDTGSCKGFAGPCWSAWLWFDLDAGDDLQRALDDARRLAAGLVERYRLDDDALLLFFSGAKGFHVGLPTLLWLPEPFADFHRGARRFAEAHASRLAIGIDHGVYDRVRAFRSPNSRHLKTGLHKRRLTFDELLGLSLDAVLQLARTPAAFDLPTPPGPCDLAAQDWQAALQVVKQEAEGKAQRRAAATNGMPTLNRSTLEFIREGAPVDHRHRLLFSAAANLAEYHCPPALAHALLTEAALDCGLSPSDVRRQIDTGLSHPGAAISIDAPLSPPPTPTPSPSPLSNLRGQLATLWSHPSEQPTPTRMTAAPPTVAAPFPSPSPDLSNQLAGLWSAAASPKELPSAPPIAETVSEIPERDRHGDAWEHPLDRLGVVDPAALAFPFGANVSGPYEKGERR